MIRGDTPHFEYVAGEAARGLQRGRACGTRLPVGFGVLTVDTMQQAVDRAGGSAGNKGHEAAAAALQAADVLAQLRARRCSGLRPRAGPARSSCSTPGSCRARPPMPGVASGLVAPHRPRAAHPRSRRGAGDATSWPRSSTLDAEAARASENWRLSRIAVVERNILRLGILELRRGDVPPKVAIDEAVRLAHWFGGARAPGFVNGVLDGIARALGRL